MLCKQHGCKDLFIYVIPFFVLCSSNSRRINEANDLSEGHTERCRSFVRSSSSKVLPTQMCAYFNLNMLYQHQRITKNIYNIFMYIAVLCAFYSTTHKHPIFCGHEEPRFFLYLCVFVHCRAKYCWFSHFLRRMISVLDLDILVFLTLNEIATTEKQTT